MEVILSSGADTYKLNISLPTLPTGQGRWERKMKDVIRRGVSELLRGLKHPSNMSPREAVAWADAHQSEADPGIKQLRHSVGLRASYHEWLVMLWRCMAVETAFQPLYEAIERLRRECGYDVSRREELDHEFFVLTEEGGSPTVRGEEVADRVKALIDAHGLPEASVDMWLRIFYLGEEWYRGKFMWRWFRGEALRDDLIHRSIVILDQDIGYEPTLEIGIHLVAQAQGGGQTEGRNVVIASSALVQRLGDSELLRLLPLPGDAVLSFNLETIRARDLRTVEKWLVGTKGDLKAGGSARSGRGHHGGKKILGDLTWRDITQLVMEHPERETDLLEEYETQRVKDKEQQYAAEGSALEAGALSEVDRDDEQRLARKEFRTRVRYWMQRL